jgi:hypothetical protein
MNKYILFESLFKSQNPDFNIRVPIDITPITISTFNTPYLNINNFSLISWLSTFGIIIIVVLTAYWFFLILKIIFDAIKASEKAEDLKKVFDRLRRLFISIAIFFLFPLVLSLVGIFAGFGNVFQWPEMFSFCKVEVQDDGSIKSSTEERKLFFYQVLFSLEDNSIEGQSRIETARAICFGRGGS